MRNCLSCRKEIHQGEGLFNRQGEGICNECLSAKLYHCNYCSGKEGSPDRFTDFNNFACNKHYAELIVICPSCDREVEKNSLYSLPTGSFSQDFACYVCRRNKYIQCSYCNYWTKNEHAMRCYDCERDYHTDGCIDSHRPLPCEQLQEDLDNSYESRPPAKEIQRGKHIGCQYLAHDRSVGVEIEVEKGRTGRLDRLLPKTAGLCSDGSLDDYTGVEVQTPPATLSACESIVTQICTILKKRRFKGTKACGLHVHVGAGDIKDDPEKLKHLVQFFFATEDLLYSMLPASRWNGHYSQMLNTSYVYKIFDDIKSGKEFDYAWYGKTTLEEIRERKGNKYDSTRYYGLNIHSIFFRGTVEFRYHSGTVEEVKILSWVSILLHMMDYIVNRYNENEVVALYNMETGAEKLEYFWHVIKLPIALQDYMSKRIQKFNKKFEVKFNLGIDKRKTNDADYKKNKAFLNKEIKKRLALELKIAQKEYPPYKSTPGIRIGGSANTKEFNMFLANERAKEYVRAKYKTMWYQVFSPGNDKGDKGFMKSHEIEDKVEEIESKHPRLGEEE